MKRKHCNASKFSDNLKLVFLSSYLVVRKVNDWRLYKHVVWYKIRFLFRYWSVWQMTNGAWLWPCICACVHVCGCLCVWACICVCLSVSMCDLSLNFNIQRWSFELVKCIHVVSCFVSVSHLKRASSLNRETRGRFYPCVVFLNWHDFILYCIWCGWMAMENGRKWWNEMKNLKCEQTKHIHLIPYDLCSFYLCLTCLCDSPIRFLVYSQLDFCLQFKTDLECCEKKSAKTVKG